MIAPESGWPTDNVWAFPLPIADPGYCIVILT